MKENVSIEYKDKLYVIPLELQERFYNLQLAIDYSDIGPELVDSVKTFDLEFNEYKIDHVNI